MLIVLPGALPDPAHARPLAAELVRVAPTLADWLAQGRALVTRTDPATDGCTAWEHWLLDSRGFRPDGGQRLAAGLGPLHATGAGLALPPDAPVWLARLAHVALSTDGAAMQPVAPDALTSAESVALFQAARESAEPAGFQLSPDLPHQWRVQAPDGFSLASISPALAAQGHLQGWWPQEPSARPWRRVINEVQMAWHDHPVNRDRAARGQPAINHLWLYGGASRAQLDAPAPGDLHDGLLAPAASQDWGGWLTALGALEATVFSPWRGNPPALLLAGHDRYVHVQPRPRQAWRFWQRRTDWRTWWSPPD